MSYKNTVKDYSQMIRFLTRDKTSTVPSAMDQEPLTMYSQGQLVQPNIDGSRPGYSGTNAETGEGFQKGHKFGRDLKGKPSLNVAGKNQYTPKTTKEIQAIIDANPDYITPNNFYEPTNTMKQKGMKKLLTFTDTQNSDVVFQRTGSPDPDPAKQTATNTKRTEAKKRLEGRIVQLKSPKGYQVHHIMPLAGNEKLNTGDYAVVSKEMNAKMSKYNVKINKLVNEAYDLDYNKTPSLKKLDKINNDLFDVLKTVKKDLPKKYEGLLGFNKLTPVLDTFDDQGKQVFSAEPQGIDYKKSIAGIKGDKIKDTKRSVIQKLVDNSPKFKSQVIPGLESLMKAADNIKGDFAKKKFLTAGFKTLGVAVGAPLIAYDTYQAYKKGKPMLEALEEGFIGTSVIGDTKKVFTLNSEEREARSVVKQDQINKKVAQDFSMLDTDFMQPVVQSNLNVDQATKDYEIAKQRVLDLETRKNADRAKNRQFSGIGSLEIDL